MSMTTWSGDIVCGTHTQSFTSTKSAHICTKARHPAHTMWTTGTKYTDMVSVVDVSSDLRWTDHLKIVELMDRTALTDQCGPLNWID